MAYGVPSLHERPSSHDTRDDGARWTENLFRRERRKKMIRMMMMMRRRRMRMRIRMMAI